MLTNECHQCQNYIEFPNEGVGERIFCPHCGTAVLLTAGSVTAVPPSAFEAPDTETFDQAAASSAKAHFEELAHEIAAVKSELPRERFTARISRIRPRVSRRWVALSALLCVVAVAGLIMMGKRNRLREQERKEAHEAAIQRVAQDAAMAKAPPGLFGAKWLMSIEEVRAACPNSTNLSPAILTERRTFYERPCLATYQFTHNAFLYGAVRFDGPSGPPEFDQTQARLTKDFGKMPAPLRAGTNLLHSKKRLGHFTVEHKLFPANGVQTEEVAFYLRAAAQAAANAREP